VGTWRMKVCVLVEGGFASKCGVNAYIRRQIEPALLAVASKRIWRIGPAVEEMTVSTSLRTKRRTERKTKPVRMPIATQPIMIFGPSTVGLGISSIIC
jgi:hypothetical protein